VSLELTGTALRSPSEEENTPMLSQLNFGRVVAFSALLWTSAALATPTPVLTSHPNSPYQLVREQKGSKVESAKSWLRTKKNQSANWLNRQKTKLKRIAE
jgi:hypothetical protein